MTPHTSSCVSTLSNATSNVLHAQREGVEALSLSERLSVIGSTLSTTS
jgi:hypothetical protein